MGPFAEVRVLELAHGVAGPFCGKLLAGLGADVLKIEPPTGDQARREGPFPGDLPHAERSGQFLHLNTNKRGATLDLQAAEGQSILGHLLAGADVAIMDWRPSDLAALGLDPAALRDRYPRLILVSVTGFGLSGPYADYAASELVACALSGYMMLTGLPEREPIKPYGSLLGYQAGLHSAIGALAALMERERTGVGALVDVSAMEAGSFLLGGIQQTAHFFGERVKRNGARNVGMPPAAGYPSTIRPCCDGHVHCHLNARNRDLLGVLVPNPRWEAPDLLDTMMGHADEIDAILDEWLADKDKFSVAAMAQELRLPFTEVLTPAEVVATPHFQERESFIEVEHPATGPVLQPGPPFRMSEIPWQSGSAPLLGEHNAEVLSRLGYTSEEVARLRAAGVI